MKELWISKYAPKKLEDVKINLPKKLRNKLINMQGGMIPHLIFSGSAGCGKVTFSRHFACRRLQDPSSLKTVSAEISVTKEERQRVIKTNHLHISRVAGTSLGLPTFLHSRAFEFISSKPMNSPYKILIIREFHLIKGQESFKRVMEKYPHCRMILTSTNPSSIISPIASRCVKFHFGKVKLVDFISELQRVGEGEGFKIPIPISKLLYSTFSGNIGIATTILQLTYMKHREITKSLVLEILREYSNLSTIPLLQASFDGSISLVKKHLDALLEKMDPIEVYKRINEEISQQEIEGLEEILQDMAKNELRLLRGNNKRVQLLNILMGL